METDSKGLTKSLNQINYILTAKNKNPNQSNELQSSLLLSEPSLGEESPKNLSRANSENTVKEAPSSFDSEREKSRKTHLSSESEIPCVPSLQPWSQTVGRNFPSLLSAPSTTANSLGSCRR